MLWESMRDIPLGLRVLGSFVALPAAEVTELLPKYFKKFVAFNALAASARFCPGFWAA